MNRLIARALTGGKRGEGTEAELHFVKGYFRPRRGAPQTHVRVPAGVAKKLAELITMNARRCRAVARDQALRCGPEASVRTSLTRLPGREEDAHCL